MEPIGRLGHRGTTTIGGVDSAKPGGMEPRDYLTVLRRRKWTVALGTLFVVGSALILSLLQSPVYQSSTRVLLRPSASIFDAGAAQQSANPVLVQTEIQLLQGERVAELVKERLGSAPPISVTSVSQTAVIEITAESGRPAQAAEIADAYANAYIQLSQRDATDALVDVSADIQTRLDTLQKDIADLDGRLAALPSCTGPSPPRECDQRGRLTQDRDALVNQVVPLRQRLNELQLGISKNSGPQVIARATVPTSPARPRPVYNGLLGLGVGLVFALGLAFVLEHFDDSIRSKEDLERCAPGLPVVGTIPALTSWKNRSETHVISGTEPNSPVAEAYRSLRTAVRFVTLDQSVRVIQITSPNVSEGKSTTVANLAVALARAGERVIVVCCDLRRPRIHEFFGLPNDVGLTSVIMGTTPLSAALQPVPGQDRLVLLASGELPPNPSELLSSNRAAQILAALQKEASVVLVDCPPVLPVTDAAVLSSRVDATILVATVGTSGRKEMMRSVELLRQVSAPLVGLVLNGTSAEGGYGNVYQRYTSDTVTGTGNGNGARPLKPRATRRGKEADGSAS